MYYYEQFNGGYKKSSNKQNNNADVWSARFCSHSIHAWIDVLTVLHVQSTFSHVISTQQILLQYYLLKYFLGKSKNRKSKIFAQKASVENIIKFLKP